MADGMFMGMSDDGRPVVAVPKTVSERKPPHGSPCNQCDACCTATLCPLGAYVFGGREAAALVATDQAIIAGPCPALEFEGDRSRCGLVADPRRFAPVRAAIHGVAALREAALHLIGSGTGCDARINGEPRDEAFNAALIRRDAARRSVTRRAPAQEKMFRVSSQRKDTPRAFTAWLRRIAKRRISK